MPNSFELSPLAHETIVAHEPHMPAFIGSFDGKPVGPVSVLCADAAYAELAKAGLVEEICMSKRILPDMRRSLYVLTEAGIWTWRALAGLKVRSRLTND
jgi:hypothetical protein